MSNWSWSSLVREHGEEKALYMLADQTGYGQYENSNGGPTKQDYDGLRTARIPEKCPLCGDSMNSTRPCGGNQ